MQESEPRFSIEELAELVGLSVRTIRYYIAEGLLPGPGSRGKAAAYSEEHLLKLRLIRRLSEQHMPLAEMQLFLARLSLDETRALLEEEQRSQESKQNAQHPTAKEYIAGLLKNAQAARSQPQGETPKHSGPGQAPALPQPSMPLPGSVPSFPLSPSPGQAGKSWSHWELAPGVELHIRSDAEYQQRNLIERLFKAVGMIFRPSSR